MHHHSKLRLSGSVPLFAVWLAFVSVSACSNTVLVGHACAAACEAENPKGVEFYKPVSVVCVCDGCSEACSVSVCQEKQAPSDVCLPCVQAALLGEPCKLAGLFGSCPGAHAECKALVDCLTACPNK
jgi:hypothetical protein